MPHVRVSSPGRICLFGEHQDYLYLPVIPAAISRRVTISGNIEPHPHVQLELPDIAASLSLDLKRAQAYLQERDYFRSAVNVMRREGYSFTRGFRGQVRGDIPINSGTSSSSALVAAWVTLLALISEQQRTLPPEEVARLAHAAEVLEFNEPGGMMDHLATAFGGVIHVRFRPQFEIMRLPTASLGAFVLGDSLQPKDTKGILARVKNGVMQIVAKLQRRYPDFSLEHCQEAQLYHSELTDEEWPLLSATLENRDLTIQAQRLFLTEPFDHKLFGQLLNQHHQVLRQALKISTPKIDRMITAALQAGALGGKINGSGGGGCMFAYAPDCSQAVADAIERQGGKAYIIKVTEGIYVEQEEK